LVGSAFFAAIFAKLRDAEKFSSDGRKWADLGAFVMRSQTLRGMFSHFEELRQQEKEVPVSAGQGCKFFVSLHGRGFVNRIFQGRQTLQYLSLFCFRNFGLDNISRF
jgi:hypothetical protein